ncbi:MAG: hypothetical protein R3A13_12710 [Bdellovibrionota bacterium]
MKKSTIIKSLDNSFNYQASGYESSYLSKLRKRVKSDRLVDLVEVISDKRANSVQEANRNYQQGEKLSQLIEKLIQ